MAAAVAVLAVGGATFGAPTERWTKVLKATGVNDVRVIQAMEAVRRSDFLPKEMQAFELDDRPLGIGHMQTTSQPSLIARMIQEMKLKPGCKVLEVGTGSGYQTALLAKL